MSDATEKDYAMAKARIRKAGYVLEHESLAVAVNLMTYDLDCQKQYIEELRHRNTEFLDMVEYAQTCAKKLQAENERLEAENRVLRHDIAELKNELYEI